MVIQKDLMRGCLMTLKMVLMIVLMENLVKENLKMMRMVLQKALMMGCLVL